MSPEWLVWPSNMTLQSPVPYRKYFSVPQNKLIYNIIFPSLVDNIYALLLCLAFFWGCFVSGRLYIGVFTSIIWHVNLYILCLCSIWPLYGSWCARLCCFGALLSGLVICLCYLEPLWTPICTPTHSFMFICSLYF